MTIYSKSVLSWGEYIDYELDGYESEPILEGGYSKLVQFLAKSMEGKVTMNMSQKLTKIDWNGAWQLKGQKVALLLMQTM